ncbi:hypothetical protein Tco_0878532 [Tanacetum coccineum]|uniref:Uncharacterized protein n=1 Tax=Tanacetum coccineum TaxID=301880 RepID=A0ABQ5BYK1_9ASTR
MATDALVHGSTIGDGSGSGWYDNHDLSRYCYVMRFGDGYVYVVYVGCLPPRRQRYRWNIAFATGCRRMGRMKRTNRRIRVPAFMRSYRIEEELILVKTFCKEVEEYVTKVIAKDGTVTRFKG